MVPVTITIPTEFLDAALLAVSKEETRYYLNGVFIDQRGYVVSTNGHIMFAASLPDACQIEEPGIIVPSAAIAMARKDAGRKEIEPAKVIRDDQGLWWLERGVVRVNFEPIDGSYPDWQLPIVPQPQEPVAGHYDPQYFSAIGKMSSAVGGGKDAAASFTLHQNGENAALVRFHCRDDCIAVIMPRKIRGQQFASPDFVDRFLGRSPAVEG